jgi:hypothetical protein
MAWQCSSLEVTVEGLKQCFIFNAVGRSDDSLLWHDSGRWNLELYINLLKFCMFNSKIFFSADLSYLGEWGCFRLASSCIRLTMVLFALLSRKRCSNFMKFVN